MRIFNEIAGAAGVAILLGACAAAPHAAYARTETTHDTTTVTPDLGECGDLEGAADERLSFHAYSEGVQISRWDGTAWVFLAPEAELFADAGRHGRIGIHYAGPTWESVSGSKV